MEESDFYRDNVAYLYRHFDDFKTKARYFMSPLPFEVKYEISTSKRRAPFQTFRLVKAPITLGALFLAWKQYPELFKIEKDGNTGMIFSFNGSPLSGQNVWNAVNVETGEIFSGNNAPSFHDRCTCLNDAVIQCEEGIEEYRRINRIETFSPATLNETVEFVKGLGND